MKDEEDFVDAEIIHTIPTNDMLSKIQWRMKGGQFIYIKDMEDSHLRNTALFLMGMGYQKCGAPEPVRVMWLRVFRMEWERREIARAHGTKIYKVYPDNIRKDRLIN